MIDLGIRGNAAVSTQKRGDQKAKRTPQTLRRASRTFVHFRFLPYDSNAYRPDLQGRVALNLAFFFFSSRRAALKTRDVEVQEIFFQLRFNFFLYRQLCGASKFFQDIRRDSNGVPRPVEKK